MDRSFSPLLALKTENKLCPYQSPFSLGFRVWGDFNGFWELPRRAVGRCQLEGQSYRKLQGCSRKNGEWPLEWIDYPWKNLGGLTEGTTSVAISNIKVFLSNGCKKTRGMSTCFAQVSQSGSCQKGLIWNDKEWFPHLFLFGFKSRSSCGETTGWASRR